MDLKVTHSKFSNISAARSGRHITIHGDFTVSHVGGRTFCVPTQLDAGARLEPESGYGHPGVRAFPSLAERTRAAMQNFAPVPFPPAPVSSVAATCGDTPIVGRI